MPLSSPVRGVGPRVAGVVEVGGGPVEVGGLEGHQSIDFFVFKPKLLAYTHSSAYMQ